MILFRRCKKIEPRINTDETRMGIQGLFSQSVKIRVNPWLNSLIDF